MGFNVNFTDNQSVTAEMLNAVAEGLSEEQASFSDGVLYGIKELNEISKAIITSGVSSGCSVSLSDSGNVLISQGTAYFADGKKITIDSDGIALVRESTSKTNYVWLLNDDVTGVVSAKCTVDVPSGDCVRLAEISKSGMVTESKDVALMKNPSLLPNFYREPIEISVEEDILGTKITQTTDTGGNYRRMVVVGGKEQILFLDWDNMTGYSSSNTTKVYDLSSQSDIIELHLSVDVHVEFRSYNNNILTMKIQKGYASHRFKIYCM